MIKTFIDLIEDKEINVEFLHSAKWKEINTPFKKRRNNYYLPFSSSHWFSIINSCVPILLLIGFLAATMVWILKNDFVKYAHNEESTEDKEGIGWKNLHGDVFRFSTYKFLFGAALDLAANYLRLWCSYLFWHFLVYSTHTIEGLVAVMH